MEKVSSRPRIELVTDLQDDAYRSGLSDEGTKVIQRYVR